MFEYEVCKEKGYDFRRNLDSDLCEQRVKTFTHQTCSRVETF